MWYPLEGIKELLLWGILYSPERTSIPQNAAAVRHENKTEQKRRIYNSCSAVLGAFEGISSQDTNVFLLASIGKITFSYLLLDMESQVQLLLCSSGCSCKLSPYCPSIEFLYGWRICPKSIPTDIIQ